MNDLNNSVDELVRFWDDLHREDSNLTDKLEELLGKDSNDQLQAYIREIENYNEEVDVDAVISEMEEARYQLENLESAIQDAMNSIDNAVSEAEDLR